MQPSIAAYPFIRHALRHGDATERAYAPFVYCEQIERLRDLGFPHRATYFTEGMCEAHVVDASINIEIDGNCTPEDLHDLLVMCDDMIANRPSRHLTRARACILASYRQKTCDQRANTPLDAMLQRVHADEFARYAREAARVQSRTSRLA